MSKEKNDLFSIVLFSIIWIACPISYDEMRIRHLIDSQETQAVINKSSIFSFKKRCSTLEGFLFSKESIEEVKVISSKKHDNLDIKTKIFITAYKLAEPSVGGYLTTGNIGSN